MSIRKLLKTAKGYLRDKPAAYFIVGFQVLLLTCAGLSAVGCSLAAEAISVVAYFMLLIGVLLVLLRSSESSDDTKNQKAVYARNGGETFAHPVEAMKDRVDYNPTPEVSIVIPAFNEEGRIENTLTKWTEFLDRYYREHYEILVVMDGCKDHTVDLVSRFAENRDSIVPLVCSERLGKGGALVEGFRWSRKEIIFFSDADGSMPIYELPKFMRGFGKKDLVIGCRYFQGSNFKANLPTSRLVFSRIFNTVLRIIFSELAHTYDTQCGAKAVHRKVIDTIWKDLFVSDFAFDVNLIYSALQNGFRIREVNIEYNHTDKESKVSNNLLKTSIAMFLSTIRLRLYYSRLRKLLYTNHLRSLIGFLLKWCYESSVV